MIFIVPTNEPVTKTCSKCGKVFIMTETRTCTSINNFYPICPKCQMKNTKDLTKSIFSIFNKNK